MEYMVHDYGNLLHLYYQNKLHNNKPIRNEELLLR